MNPLSRLALPALILAIALTPTGCSVLKPSIAPLRHFVLAPVPASEPPATTEPVSVGIGPVKMPAYLLRTSMAVRQGTNELEYLDNARWGERLDQCFQRTVAANLSRLLLSDRVYSTEWASSQVTVRVFVDVQQFEVDREGLGTLIAHWRITAPDSNTPLKSGLARLNQAGPSPQGNPAVIPATMSELTAEFSRILAQAIREASPPKN